MELCDGSGNTIAAVLVEPGRVGTDHWSAVVVLDEHYLSLAAREWFRAATVGTAVQLGMTGHNLRYPAEVSEVPTDRAGDDYRLRAFGTGPGTLRS